MCVYIYLVATHNHSWANTVKVWPCEANAGGFVPLPTKMKQTLGRTNAYGTMQSVQQELVPTLSSLEPP